MTDIGQPARVVVVVSQLSFGGAERQTVELLRHLCGTPWAPVRVVCLSTDVKPYGDDVRALGYPLTIVHRGGAFDVGRCLALNRLLRQDRADIVHALNWFAAGYAVLARPRGARVVSSIRNSHLPAGAVRRMAFPRLIRRSARVLVNSARGRQLVAHTCRIPPERVALVHNGIDVDALRSAATPGALRAELGLGLDTPIVAYVGRNARVKNIPRLLAVIRRLRQTRPDVHVVLAGEGLGPALVAHTDLSSDARVSCLGPRQDVPTLLRDADVLVLTSDNEGMPNVVLEALASGVPIVATDVGDLTQMVPARCGVLVPPESEPLAAAIVRVLADPAYRRAAEQYVTTIAATYSCRAVAERTVAVWKDCLLAADQGRMARPPRAIAPRSRSVPS